MHTDTQTHRRAYITGLPVHFTFLIAVYLKYTSELINRLSHLFSLSDPGCKKIIIKSHGSSKAAAIVASIKQVISLYKNQINDIIENSVKDLTAENLKGEQNGNI